MSSVKDCPVIETDIALAEKIFGKDVAGLKGKTTRKKPNVLIHDTIAIPPELQLAQHDVTLCINAFYINKMVFVQVVTPELVVCSKCC
jgi:hypothetical protein